MSQEQQLELQLHQGVAALGIAIPADVQTQLLRFIQLLLKWNKAYNLTAIRDPAEMVTKHLLDSLAMLPFLQDGEIIDIGTGPGLPGIPLSLVRKNQPFTLLDSNSKKTRFVTQAVMELGIRNVTVVQSRAESFQPAHPYDVVIARAFAGIKDLLERVQHLCAPGARVIAMKGQFPEGEMDDWPAGFSCESVEKISIPGMQAERHVVLIRYD